MIVTVIGRTTGGHRIRANGVRGGVGGGGLRVDYSVLFASKSGAAEATSSWEDYPEAQQDPTVSNRAGAQRLGPFHTLGFRETTFLGGHAPYGEAFHGPGAAGISCASA